MITLEQALKAVPGVRAASVTIRDGAPPAVRVELMEGADERLVAEAVQEVLAEHGLRSHVAPPRVKVEPAAAPPPPGPAAPSGRRPQPSPEPPAGGQPGREAGVAEVGAAEVGQADEGGVSAGGRAVGHAPRPALRSVEAVEVATEDGSAVVTVRLADGTTSRVRTRPDDSGIAEAIVHAIARLLDPGGVLPRLAGVERRLVGGVDVVTAALDVGAPKVGTAVVPGSYELGLARAVAVALSL